MGNIIDYLNWRGDLTFTERPFCDVDNLVFSQLSYLDLSGIVPDADTAQSILLEDAMDEFLKQGRKGVGAMPEHSSELALALKRAKRFSGLLLTRLREKHDTDTGTDFSALQILLDENTAFIAYRGTGDTLVGWQEDFSMSFQVMPSQELAAEYLRKAMEGNTSRFYIGGHSKGGNLAVYAAAQQTDDLAQRILKIYCNDGPGFCEEILDYSRYQVLQDRIINIVPEFCVVGELFTQPAPTCIVKSSANGILQHNAMSWQIEGTDFVRCEQLCRDCQVYNQVIDQWLEASDLEQRKSFTKNFFAALTSGGATTLSEVSQNGISDFGIILLSVANSEKPTKIMLMKFFRSVGSAFSHISPARMLHEKKLLQGVLLFLAGLFLAVKTEFAAQLIGIGIGVALVVWLGNKLLNAAFSRRDTVEAAKIRVVMYLVFICIVMYLVAQRSLLLQCSNLILAACFLITAYRFALPSVRKGTGRLLRVCCAIIALLSFCMGMLPIIVTSFPLSRYIFLSGILILLYGVGTMLHAAWLSSNS